MSPSPAPSVRRPLPAPSHEPRFDEPRRATTATDVLRAVLDHGPVARSTVGRLTGLSAAAVSRQFTELTELGLVRDRPSRPARSRVGRPHVPVDVDTRRHLVGGVHIAVEHCTCVLMDLRGRVLAQRRVPHRDPADAATVLADAARELGTIVEDGVLGVGLATGGWVDPRRGVLVRHPQLDWHDVPVARMLADRLGLPVRVDNHARALARAEQLVGAHRDRARVSLVQLFVGNVVDAAIATGGEVHHGPGSGAGDVSHLPVGDGRVLGGRRCPCGRFGCVQATVADRVVAVHAAGRGLLDRPRFADATAALEAGADWATALFHDRARLIGRVVAVLLDVINPELLVVTEAGIARRPELLAALHDEVARRSHIVDDPTTTVVAGSFGTSALAVAAGAVLLHEVYSRPLDLSGQLSRPARS